MTPADDAARESVVKRIAAVRTRFLDNLDGRARELAEFTRRAQEGDGVEAQTARDALRLGLHNIAGAAPTLGLQALGRKAAELEAVLMGAPAQSGPLDAATSERLLAGLERLSDIKT